MEGGNSKAMIAIMFAVLLASSSMPTHVEASDWFWCRLNCLRSCLTGGMAKKAFCFLTCLQNCKHDLLSPGSLPSPADHCDVGCLTTSCLELSDPDSQEKCADSCSQSCQASYAGHQ